MAEKSRKDETLRELRARIERSRTELGQDLAGLRYELDIPLKIRRSFQSQTIVWITALAAIGVVVSLLPARRKKVYVEAKGRGKGKEAFLEAGLLMGGLKLATSLLKPIIVNYAIQKMQGAGAGSRPRR